MCTYTFEVFMLIKYFSLKWCRNNLVLSRYEWGSKKPISRSGNDGDFFLVTIYTLELTLSKFKLYTILFGVKS